MRYLMILEVSQKQAYIFESTKLKDNVERSEEICQVTDPEYFKLAAERSGLSFDVEANVVYSGGGHTVLEFPDKESAEKFAYAVSSRVRREFAELEYFIKTMEYDESEGVGPGPNLFHLSQALEKKKSQCARHHSTRAPLAWRRRTQSSPCQSDSGKAGPHSDAGEKGVCAGRLRHAVQTGRPGCQQR